jgi:hypothetical protein
MHHTLEKLPETFVELYHLMLAQGPSCTRREDNHSVEIFKVVCRNVYSDKPYAISFLKSSYGTRKWYIWNPNKPGILYEAKNSEIEAPGSLAFKEWIKLCTLP